MSGKAKVKKEKEPKEVVSPETSKVEEPKEVVESGFLKEISDAINDAVTMDDLEALQPKVYTIWGDTVPAKIQELAAKKGEEITANAPPSKNALSKKRLQEDWIDMTEEEAGKYDKEGILFGYDPLTKTGKLSK